MQPPRKSIPERLLRFIVHFLLLLVFMTIADHLMRLTFREVWRYTPFLVNLAGAVVYLLVVFVVRKVFHFSV